MALFAFGITVKTFQRRTSSQKTLSDNDTLIVYDYSFLQHCTKNFSDKLGQGSFGSVLKGLLPEIGRAHI